MSTWISVIGSFTLRDIPEKTAKKYMKKLYKKLGPIEDYGYFYKDTTITIPTGSEGSLKYIINKRQSNRYFHKRFNDMKKYDIIVTIWGHLRKQNNTKEIKKWFEDIIYDCNLPTDDAVMSIKCPYYDADSVKRIVIYNRDEHIYREIN